MNEREQRVWDKVFVATVQRLQAMMGSTDINFTPEELAEAGGDEADFMLKAYRLAMEERDDE
jgi:hypothetical protein